MKEKWTMDNEGYISDAIGMPIASVFPHNRQHNGGLITAAPEMAESLQTMTALCRLKYGNLDPDVWQEILKAEVLLSRVEGRP